MQPFSCATGATGATGIAGSSADLAYSGPVDHLRNVLTGATRADGGHDPFFLDDALGTTWDTFGNVHPGNSVTL